MKRSDNFSTTSLSKKEKVRLEELRQEKEKILQEMKIREERKKKRMEKVTQKEFHLVAKNTLTEPIVEYKVPKFQIKSFNEIMQEANERELVKKRKLSTTCHTSAKKVKIAVNEDTSINNSQIPSSTKKSDNLKTNSNKNINKHSFIQSNFVNRNQKNESQIKKPEINRKNDLKKSSQNRHRSIVEQNSKQFPTKGIISQNGFKQYSVLKKVPDSLPVTSNSRGILAQNKIVAPQYSSDSEEQGSDLDGFIDDSEGMLDEEVRKEIYESLRFDPSKYEKVSCYDDCKNMESSSKQIQIEESKSIKVAKQEDLKEARLEMQRLKKKGKL